MPRDEPMALERREAESSSAPVVVLLLAIVLVLAAMPASVWLRARPPVWPASAPPPTIHCCGRDYRDPHRHDARLPSDPTGAEPRIEAVDGERLQFPAVQTTRFNGNDVCSTVLQIHDATGWVAYGLVGGPWWSVVADAGRVIAGTARGIRLQAPGPGTRPLGDRVKQTLFAILEPDLPGARVLDLFAGSGAGGIEALSRGAASAVFVERDASAASVITGNLRATYLGDANRATVVRADAAAFLARLTGDDPPFDIVIVDPPYADAEVRDRVLGALGAIVAPLATDARVVVKHFWRDQPPARVGLLASERERRFGETALTFYRRQEGG